MRWSWKRPSIPEKYQPWLTENGWWLNFLALALAAFALVGAFQRGNWAPWMGFSGKTVWDWLDLLGVPLTLAILGYILQQQERNRAETLKEQERVRAKALSREQRERDEKVAQEQREIAANETKEEILQVYFDRLSTLLVDKNILAIAVKVHPQKEKQRDDQSETTITPEEQELFNSAVDIIRARTLSILRRFEGDAERRSSVIRFLIEAEIIGKAKLSLKEADLSGTRIEGADLKGVNLVKADLDGANLNGADLKEASLNSAKLKGIHLIGASLKGASLLLSDIKEAYLIGAILEGANLRGADLSGADLRGANLVVANLVKANLSGADLSGADLSGADLNEADLRNITQDNDTFWPDSTEVAKALNIPEALKQQLGITDTTEVKSSDA